MADDNGLELALVVGAARSGTTLLRLLLDAHPEIGCPAEAGLPALMSHMAQVWVTIDADVRDDTPATDPGQRNLEPDGANMQGGTAGEDHGAEPDPPVNTQRLPEPARTWIRTTVTDAMRRYCEREHKRLYIDKSLDSVYHLPLVDEMFPGIRCVLAFRHVMDTIASGIEASPWGFQAYGYHPYVQRFPGNTVAALASYWLDHVTQALEWEKQHPDACIRVRYEDLVGDPEATIAAIQRFLGVSEHLDVLRRAFEREPARGPGDYKIEHTSAVHANSVGHGKRVPVSMLPPPLLEAVNEKLQQLQYPRLDRSWNAAERDTGASIATVWTERLSNLMASTDHGANRADADIGSLALVAEDHNALRWIVDLDGGSVMQGDGDVEAVLTGTCEDLVLMLTGEENLGVLLRSGRIRHVVADEQQSTPRDLQHEIATIVTALRAYVSDRPASQDTSATERLLTRASTPSALR